LPQVIVMLNLLIAIMGGSFEDISENAAPEILKQKAELLLSIIAEMPDHDRDLDKFPVRQSCCIRLSQQTHWLRHGSQRSDTLCVEHYHGVAAMD
jgi:hypothetical protein